MTNEDISQNPEKLRALALERGERIDRLEGALEFYADPETYHGVSFIMDPPGGGWDEDFSDDHGHPDYDRPMPGKRAREALTDADAVGGEECPSCNGTGNNPIRDGFKCFDCNGTGQSNLKEPSFYEREALAKQVPPRHRDALEALEHLAGFATSGGEVDERCLNECRSLYNTIKKNLRALAQHSEPGRGETCPVCEKGTLTRIECCICDNCDATPVLTDQIRRNDKRLAARLGRIPEGWKLVPMKATIKMADAADKELRRPRAASELNRCLCAYSAMIAAAPAPDADERE